MLLVENFAETVDVKQDAQAGAADRRSDAFGSVLTREQMDALSDDPDEMQRQLMDMAGPGAIMRIDSFEGGRLPPKSQIKSIRVTRDQFAAENHSADSFFIEVITQPGIGPIRTGVRYGLRNSAMSARNAFTPTKGEEQDQQYGFNIGGGLIQNKASFFLSVQGNSVVRHAELEHRPIDGHALRDAQAACAARVHVRQREFRLGRHARSDAAVQLQPRRLREQEPGHRRIRRARARVHFGESRTTRSARRRWARWAAGSSSTRV